jgi:hypothetical protein
MSPRRLEASLPPETHLPTLLHELLQEAPDDPQTLANCKPRFLPEATRPHRLRFASGRRGRGFESRHPDSVMSRDIPDARTYEM